MKKEIPHTCKTCTHFKHSQRELNYYDDIGFCTNKQLNFNTFSGRLIGVYDKLNLKDTSKVKGNPTHDIETISDSPIGLKDSRYCLQVQEEFGCIFHTPEKQAKTKHA